MSTILSTVSNNVATITLNREKVHQAFNSEMILAISDAFESFGKDKNVKAIILQSSGKSFCAGADVHYMQEMANYTETDNFKDAKELAAMFYKIYTCPTPTIAKIQGNAFGGGVGLACACDIAVAVDSAEFCLSEVKLGLVPAVISPYVINALGARVAKYWMLTGKRFSAQAAYNHGLVHEICTMKDLDTTVLDIANMLKNNGPKSMQAVKTIFDSSTKAIANSQEVLCHMIARLRVSEEGQKGLQAFLQKQKPNWD